MTDHLPLHDAALPALPVLLSEAALSDYIGEPLRITRVRYKPQTSLVIGWARAGSSGDLTDHGWAGVYADPVKVRHALQTARRRGGHAEPLGLPGHGVFADLTADRALARDLSRLRTRIDDATVIRHNPLRRVVLRGRLDDADVAFRVTDRPVEAIVTTVSGLAMRGAPVVPLSRIRRARQSASSPWWGDHDLTGTTDAETVADAGRALAELHRIDPLPGHTAPCPDLSGLGEAVTAISPELTPRIERLRRILADRWRAPTALHRLHGDFSADQVLVGTGVRLIDLDHTHLGPAERDLGSFIAVETLTGSQTRSTSVVEGYRAAGGHLDDECLTWWEAYECLARLSEPFRRFEPAWPTRIDTLLTHIEEVIARWTPSLT